MSKLTATQHATLVWLDKIGGTATAWRDKIVYPPYAALCESMKALSLEACEMTNQQRRQMPAVSALHLVQRGAIEARAGQLHITEYGRRLIAP